MERKTEDVTDLETLHDYLYFFRPPSLFHFKKKEENIKTKMDGFPTSRGTQKVSVVRGGKDTRVRGNPSRTEPRPRGVYHGPGRETIVVEKRNRETTS